MALEILRLTEGTYAIAHVYLDADRVDAAALSSTRAGH